MASYTAKFQCRVCGDWAESVVLEANTMYQASLQQMDCSNCDGKDTMEVTELVENEPRQKPAKVWRIARDEPSVVRMAKRARSVLSERRRDSGQNKDG